MTSQQTTSSMCIKVKEMLERLTEKGFRHSEEKLSDPCEYACPFTQQLFTNTISRNTLTCAVCDEPDAENKQAFHPRNSRIPAGDERTIEGTELTFERKETFNIRGVEVEPSKLLGDNFSKHPLVSDLVSRQYNSLQRIRPRYCRMEVILIS